MTADSPGQEDLPNGLEFGVIKTDDELDELIKFSATVHNELIAQQQRRLIESLPGFGREMNFIIRELDSGEIVSSLSAIPCIWEYDGIELKSLELEFAGTSESYRRKGLFRILYRHFEEELRRGEYHLSSLQGIPHFFRQFGYDFSFPLPQFSGFELLTGQIPSLMPEEDPNYMELTVRDAKKKDLDEITRLYDELGRRLLVRSGRSRDLWEMQEKLKTWRAFSFDTMVVESDDQIEGYFRTITHDKDSPMTGVMGFTYLDVIESSIRNHNGVMRVLQHLKETAQKEELQAIKVPGIESSNLSKVVLDLGAEKKIPWRYQIRIPDMVYFLKAISPALERNLVNTMFERMTQDLTLNTYESCFSLKFENGRISEVKELGPVGGGILNARPHDLVRLVFGELAISELSELTPDCSVWSPLKSFVKTLFPKRESHMFYNRC
ncbi:MAG: GNAT family N-acetyltransferase [Candidatus Thorarchaeota archaeon]|nr:MAG: GNAT family N-acetyltransferase [Candidatus Thorarchaeota archaeon]